MPERKSFSMVLAPGHGVPFPAEAPVLWTRGHPGSPPVSCLSLTSRADGVSQLSPTILALGLVSWKKNFSMDQTGAGGGFRMIQVHYNDCAPKAADLTGGGA